MALLLLERVLGRGVHARWLANTTDRKPLSVKRGSPRHCAHINKKCVRPSQHSIMLPANSEAPADVLTLVEAATFLRCGPKTVRRLARLKRIPCREIDLKGSLRFSRAALGAWLRDGGAR